MPKEGKVWLFLASGFSIWILAEAIWLYAGISGTRPTASAVNIISLVGFIPIIAGFWIEFKIVKEGIKKADLIKSIIVVLAVAAISLYFIIMPVIAMNYTILVKIIYLLFQAGDIIILFFTLIFFFAFRKGKVSHSWMIITIAMVLGAIASVSFTYLNWNNAYSGFSLIVTQLLWIADYILLAIGAYYHRLVLRLGV